MFIIDFSLSKDLIQSNLVIIGSNHLVIIIFTIECFGHFYDRIDCQQVSIRFNPSAKKLFASMLILTSLTYSRFRFSVYFRHSFFVRTTSAYFCFPLVMSELAEDFDTSFTF